MNRSDMCTAGGHLLIKIKGGKNMKVRAFVLGVSFLLSASTGFASDASVLGRWKTAEEKAVVEISACGEQLCGKIVSLKEPLYTDAKEGALGKPKLDHKNPVATLQKRPVLGMQLLEGFTPTGERTWGHGTIYDAENGKTYKCNMKLTSQNKLELRGYIGISLIGRTEVWTR